MIRRTAMLSLILAAAAAAGANMSGAGAQGGAKRVFAGAVKPIGPYSPGIGVGDTVYLAGQIGLDPATGALVSGGVEAETRQVMQNLGAVLKEAGLSYGNVVKSTIFLADINDFAKMNEIYGGYFKSGPPPVRSTVGVAALPRAARVEIEFIAAR
jgi:2-iminobutanoate/2-iminopropanoate deaminase